MKIAIIAALALAASVPAAAQTLPDINDVRVLGGQCSPDSHIAIGDAATDISDPQNHMPFRCTNMVMSIHEGPGTFMISFPGDGTNGEGVIIGFAGILANKSLLAVQRVYIDADAFRVNDGHCDIFRDNGVVTSVSCGANVGGTEITVVPIIGFTVE